MADLKESAITLLSSTAGVDLNGAPAAETTLLTVPIGKTAIITHVILRTASADCSTAVVTLGVPGGTCDEWLGDQALTLLDGVTKYVTLYSDQGTSQTPEGGILFASGTAFGLEITTAQGGAATVTVDVFGYLF
jgi:hypothetical protein